IQTFRVGLAPGPLSFLGPYCPTPAAHGHTSTPPAPQSHPRPRKTPRSTDLGVKSTPSGGASGIQDGEGTTDTCGSAEVKVRGGVPPPRHPSAVRPYPPRRREPPPPGTGRLRLPLVPRSTRSSRHPPGRKPRFARCHPPPRGIALRAPTDDGMDPHHAPPVCGRSASARPQGSFSSRSTPTHPHARAFLKRGPHT